MASPDLASDHPHHDVRVHGHRHPFESGHRLSIVLLLTAGYMVAEAVGGWWTGSLALLADAGHMFTDVAALALALAAVWFGSRPATPSKTYGS
jgi:cobalt-zinc-cadmium efflux system protein